MKSFDWHLNVWCSVMPCFLLLQRLYREKGENMKHNYTLSEEMPEFAQAKLNAMNISEVKPHSREHTHIQWTHEIHQSIRSAAFVWVLSHRNWVYTSAMCVFRAVTRNLGLRYVMVVTSCVWMPFPSSLPKHLQTSSVMWACNQTYTLCYHILSFSQWLRNLMGCRLFWDTKSSIFKLPDRSFYHSAYSV